VENLFMTGKYDKATDVLKSYLSEFPEGSFRQNARITLQNALNRQEK